MSERNTGSTCSTSTDESHVGFERGAGCRAEPGAALSRFSRRFKPGADRRNLGSAVQWAALELHSYRFGQLLAKVLPHRRKSKKAIPMADLALGFLASILAGAQKLVQVAHLRADVMLSAFLATCQPAGRSSAWAASPPCIFLRDLSFPMEPARLRFFLAPRPPAGVPFPSP